jgi:hypothetical protein
MRNFAPNRGAENRTRVLIWSWGCDVLTGGRGTTRSAARTGTNGARQDHRLVDAVRLSPSAGVRRARARGASGGVLQRGAGLPVGVVPAAARAGDVRPRGRSSVLTVRQSRRAMGHKRTVNVRTSDVPPAGGHVSAWWWVPVGVAAWLSVSLAVGLLLARFFRNSAQARDAMDALAEERLAERQEPPQDGPRVALWAPMSGALRHLFPCTAIRREPAGPVPSAARAGGQDVERGSRACCLATPRAGARHISRHVAI